jgi:N-sulfoglucosamine sulfohydrolase
MTQEWKRLYAKDSLNEIQKQFFRKSRPEEELFDIQKDPYEVKNLAGKAEYKNVLEQMREVNQKHMESIGDMGFVPEIDLVERFWPDGEQPQTMRPLIRQKGVVVEIICQTEGASIVFKINKENDKWAWKKYTYPFHVNREDTVFSKAVRYGYNVSAITKKIVQP